MVTAVHCPDLRDGDVALVDEGYEIIREIVNQAEGPLTGFPAVEVAGIILNPGAVPHLLDHLQIVLDPLLQALGLQSFPYLVEIFYLSFEVILDLAYRLDAPLPCRDEVCGREYRDLIQVLDPGACDRIYQ